MLEFLIKEWIKSSTVEMFFEMETLSFYALSEVREFLENENESAGIEFI